MQIIRHLKNIYALGRN